MCCFGGAPAVGGRGGKEAAAGRSGQQVCMLLLGLVEWSVLVLDSFRFSIEHDMHLYAMSVCVCAVSKFSHGLLSGCSNLYYLFIMCHIML